MGVDGEWNFYKVPDNLFPAVNLELANVKRGLINIVDDYVGFVDLPEENAKNGVLTLSDNRGEFLHKPFVNLGYRIFTEVHWKPISFISGALQYRVLPTVVLFNGIGRERFSKLARQ